LCAKSEARTDAEEETAAVIVISQLREAEVVREDIEEIAKKLEQEMLG
jgi:hypothetical protein